MNSDSNELLLLAESLGARAFKRDAAFASDESTGDDFTFNFIESLDCDFLAMINPVCPLLEPSTVRLAVDTFWENRPDTLIACTQTGMQVAVEGSFVNIDPNAPLRPTQENPKAQILNWAITIWDAQKFRSNYVEGTGAYCGTNRVLFPIPPLEGIKVSEEDDFLLAERLLAAKSQLKGSEPVYWSSANMRPS